MVKIIFLFLKQPSLGEWYSMKDTTSVQYFTNFHFNYTKVNKSTEYHVPSVFDILGKISLEYLTQEKQFCSNTIWKS
jgi:hypothetical protein